MDTLSLIKWPLIIFLVGFLIRLAGSLVKIRHWPWGDELITIGYLVCGIGVVIGIVKLIMIRKPSK